MAKYFKISTSRGEFDVSGEVTKEQYDKASNEYNQVPEMFQLSDGVVCGGFSDMDGQISYIEVPDSWTVDTVWDRQDDLQSNWG